MNIQNKVAIVTGSAQGVGRETAELLLNKGAKVVFVDKNKKNLEKLKARLGSENTIFVSCDLTVEKNSKKIVEETIKKFGKIDILINNVGVGFRGRFEETQIDYFKKGIDVNLMTAVYMTKYSYSEILKAKGSIIFITSTSSIRGLPGYGAYSVSKAAINSFADVLDIESSKDGIHVGKIIFGPIETEEGKTILGTSGEKEYIKSPVSVISMKKAAKKILTCIKKRKSQMVVGKLSHLLYYSNRISYRLTRLIIKKFFKCPKDYK